MSLTLSVGSFANNKVSDTSHKIVVSLFNYYYWMLFNVFYLLWICVVQWDPLCLVAASYHCPSCPKSLNVSVLFYIVFFPCKLSASGLLLVFLCEHSLRWIDWKCRDVILPLHFSESDTANEGTRITHQTDHYRNCHIDVEFYHECDVVNSSFWLCATRHSRWSACTLQNVNWCPVKSQVLTC